MNTNIINTSKRQMRSYFISSAQNIKPEPGLHPEIYLQRLVVNRVRRVEVPSSHAHTPIPRLAGGKDEKHKLHRQR